MISLLSGTVASKNASSITLLTAGGVGYDVFLTAHHAATLAVEQSIHVSTYLRVSDSALNLYGFEDALQKEFFELLLSVSGVGPKTAMNILSLGSLEKISSAISRGDVAYLTSVQGIGKKTAERIVVELKSKIKEQGTRNKTDGQNGDVLSEVVDGLVALGYSKEEARSAVQEMETEGKDAAQLIKQALRELK